MAQRACRESRVVANQASLEERPERDREKEKLKESEKERERELRVKVEVKVVEEDADEGASRRLQSKPERNEQSEEASQSLTRSNEQAQEERLERPNRLSLLNPSRSGWVSASDSASSCNSCSPSQNCLIESASSSCSNWNNNNNNNQSNNYDNNYNQATTNLLYPCSPRSSFSCSTGIVIASPTRQSVLGFEAALRLSSRNQLKSLSSCKLSSQMNCEDDSCNGDDYVEDENEKVRSSRSRRLQPIQICRQLIDNQPDTFSHESSQSQTQTQTQNNNSTSSKRAATFLNVQQSIPRTFSASALGSGATTTRRQSGGSARSGSHNASGSASGTTGGSSQRFSFWESLVNSSGLEHRSKSQYIQQISSLDQAVASVTSGGNNSNQYRAKPAISAGSANLLQQQQQQQDLLQNQQAQLLQLPTASIYGSSLAQTRKR